MILFEFDHVLLLPLLCLLSQNCLASLTYSLAGVWPCAYVTALGSAVSELLCQFDVQLDRSLAVYLHSSSWVCCHWTALPVWQTTWQSLAVYLHDSSSAGCHLTALPVWCTTWQEFGCVLTWQLLCLLSLNCSANLTYNLTGVWPCTYMTALVPTVTELLCQFDVQLGRSLTLYLPDSSCACHYRTAQPVWCTTWQESDLVLTQQLFCLLLQNRSASATCSSASEYSRSAEGGSGSPEARTSRSPRTRSGQNSPQQASAVDIAVPGTLLLVFDVWHRVIYVVLSFQQKRAQSWCTPHDSLFGSLPQTLLCLVMPLKGHFWSPRICVYIIVTPVGRALSPPS